MVYLGLSRARERFADGPRLADPAAADDCRRTRIRTRSRVRLRRQLQCGCNAVLLSTSRDLRKKLKLKKWSGQCVWMGTANGGVNSWRSDRLADRSRSRSAAQQRASASSACAGTRWRRRSAAAASGGRYGAAIMMQPSGRALALTVDGRPRQPATPPRVRDGRTRGQL